MFSIVTSCALSFPRNLEWGKKGQNNLISECVSVKFPNIYKVKH